MRIAYFGMLAVLALTACTPLEGDQGQTGDNSNDSADAAPSSDSGDTEDAYVLNVRGLTGTGLVVRLPDNSQMLIDANGEIQTSVPTSVEDVDIMVVSAPTKPHQECTIEHIGRNGIAVYCVEKRGQIGGVVDGLEGNGLVLGVDNVTPEDISIDQSGGFQFSRPLQADTDYSVVVRKQPSWPRQMCSVENGSGLADGSDITNVKVHCVTDGYHVKANVVGLTGTGLAYAIQGGAAKVVDASGTYDDGSVYADGTMLVATITAQPKNAAQRCYLHLDDPVVNGKDVELNIICGANGKLRISEVGACPYTTSSCWLEIFNVGDTAEDLAFYSLRTSAIGPLGRVSSHTFALPFASVPGFKPTVVQAGTPSSMPDGSNIVHVTSSGLVPYWGADGFVELLDKNGSTIDFVRFGRSTENPVTGGTWGGGTVAALPIGPSAFGRSIAHTRNIVPFSASKDWVSRAHATYAGLNDVDVDDDADKDGIPDASEAAGATFCGVDVYAMGARVGQLDVFVEIDFMASSDPGVAPRREALDAVVAAFARRGVALHFDAGSLFSRDFSPSLYNLGGGTVVPFAPAIGIGKRGSEFADLYEYKAVYMEGRRRSFFYYMLFANSQQADGSKSASGVSEVLGNDSIITLGNNVLSGDSPANVNKLINYQAATIMHELGHNLGLRHGGGDNFNNKPNYLSVMNYLYSPYGLSTVGISEGDRYYLTNACNSVSLSSLVNPPSGLPSAFRLDYSDGSGDDIDEGYINERRGLGRLASGSVDFNCDGRITGGYQRDINGDNAIELLTDYNDWANLRYTYARVDADATGVGIFDVTTDLPHDFLSDDQSVEVAE